MLDSLNDIELAYNFLSVVEGGSGADVIDSSYNKLNCDILVRRVFLSLFSCNARKKNRNFLCIQTVCADQKRCFLILLVLF